MFISVCVVISVGVSAQTVSGKLIDENSQPLPYANVVLLSLPDSAFVNGTISGEDGSFTLEATSENQIVKISSIGYRTVCKPVSSASLGIIQLVSDAQMLGEVVVKGNLPVTRIKGDAMVTGVAGTALEKAGTAEQMLDKIPNVTSKDGEINVFGRGTPEIYVNGRKLLDNSELDRLSAENIKSVEVVNNPGARYGAEVTSVIRIITKKAEGEGFGFDNRAMFQYNRDWSALEQLNFNYRKDGWDFCRCDTFSYYRYLETAMALPAEQAVVRRTDSSRQSQPRQSYGYDYLEQQPESAFGLHAGCGFYVHK